MIRYHGVLSSHAKARAEVVPKVEALPVQLPLFKQARGADRDLDVLAPEPRRKPWACCCGTCSRSTSRRVRGAAARPAGSRPQPRPTPSRGCSRSMASAPGRHRQGRPPEASCGSRSQEREGGERRATGRSVRAARGGAASARARNGRRASHSRGSAATAHPEGGAFLVPPRHPGSRARGGSGRLQPLFLLRTPAPLGTFDRELGRVAGCERLKP